MAESFPNFLEPSPLPDGATWTAAFESHDWRTQWAYYIVSRREVDGEHKEFWARVVSLEDPDVAHLLRSVSAVALAGESNTSYIGGPGWTRLRDWLVKQTIH